MRKIKGNIYNENYIDMDTNQGHNLIIYDYSIDNKNDKLFIGEIIDNTIDAKALINCLNEIANYNISGSHQIFACSLIKHGISKKTFENVNFSKQGYNFIFNKDLSVLNYSPKIDYSDENFIEKLKEIVIIDYIRKSFCSIGDNLGSYPLEYYQETEDYLEIGKQKCLTYPNVANN